MVHERYEMLFDPASVQCSTARLPASPTLLLPGLPICVYDEIDPSWTEATADGRALLERLRARALQFQALFGRVSEPVRETHVANLIESASYWLLNGTIEAVYPFLKCCLC